MPLDPPPAAPAVGSLEDSLARAAARSGGMLATVPASASPGDQDDTFWRPLASVLEPDTLAAIAGDTATQLETVPKVSAALIARAVTTLVTAAVIDTWARDRRVLDVSAANLRVHLDGLQAQAQLVELRAWVLADDPAAGEPWARVETSESALRARCESVLLDAFLAPLVDAVRAVVRTGPRHLWGNAALSIANTLTTTSHEIGERADHDRTLILADRPELAATVIVRSAPDGNDGTFTFAVRRTCCLLVRVPGAGKCGTCSLRPLTERVDACTSHYRFERAARR